MHKGAPSIVRLNPGIIANKASILIVFVFLLDHIDSVSLNLLTAMFRRGGD